MYRFVPPTQVRVWGGGKQHFIGSFVDEVEAARAYDKAVLRLRGGDARSRSRMNFPVSAYNLDEIAAEPLGSLAALMGVAGGEGMDYGGDGGGGGGGEGGGRAKQQRGGGSGRKAAGIRRRREDNSEDEEYGGDDAMGRGGGAGPSRMLQQHHQQHQQHPQLQQQFQLFQQYGVPPQAGGSGSGAQQQGVPPAAAVGTAGGSGTGSGAMALAAALSATGHGGNVAAAAIASLPAVSIYYDEPRRKWASALVVADNATVLGYSDNESSARRCVQACGG